MTPADEKRGLSLILKRCEALFEDLEFNAVREWKAAAPGRKAMWWGRRGASASSFSTDLAR